MKQLILILFIGISSFQCNFITKKVYGVKKPNTENEKTISSWLLKNRLPNENIVCMKPDSFMLHFVNYSSSPLLFDVQTGNYVSAGFIDGKFCPKDIDIVFNTIMPYYLLRPRPDNFITTHWKVIKDKDSVNENSGKDFLDLYSHARSMTDLRGKEFLIGKDSSDYILFIPFALCFGKRLQVKDLHKYYKAANSNQRSKIKVVFVNFDKQEWWGDDWNEKLQIMI